MIITYRCIRNTIFMQDMSDSLSSHTSQFINKHLIYRRLDRVHIFPWSPCHPPPCRHCRQIAYRICMTYEIHAVAALPLVSRARLRLLTRGHHGHVFQLVHHTFCIYISRNDDSMVRRGVPFSDEFILCRTYPVRNVHDDKQSGIQNRCFAGQHHVIEKKYGCIFRHLHKTVLPGIDSM